MRRVNRKRPIDYILPFLVILGLGVIGILGFQLWKNFEKQGKADVYFYVAEGKAKVLPYGQATWDNAFSGTKLLLGDALKTPSVGKVTMAFFNGTFMRMGPDTAVTLTDIKKDSEREKIVLTMDNGMLWVNGSKSPGVKEALYEIRTSHMQVKAKGTVFEVESNTAEVVRVMDGEVTVDVLVKAEGKERVAESITVGVGQEITLDEATLKAYEDNQSPSVLMAINDQFKAGDWYQWNIKEDRNPTSYDSTTGEAPTPSTLETSEQGTGEEIRQNPETMQTSESATQEPANTLEEEFSGSLESPVILKPGSEERTVDKGPVSISGSIAAGTEKVVVEQVLDGKTEKYTLSRFKPGDTSFTYNVSDILGNLKEGENTYSFYAVDAKGNKSDASEITIVYNKQKVEITDSLEAPVVLKFNGSESSTVTADKVLVEGQVKGAEKVVVNGYPLSKFEPGSTTWAYIASEVLGNLSSGLNEFEVYAIDTEGNKSAAVKFTITYDKPSSGGAGGTNQPVYGF